LRATRPQPADRLNRDAGQLDDRGRFPVRVDDAVALAGRGQRLAALLIDSGYAGHRRLGAGEDRADAAIAQRAGFGEFEDLHAAPLKRSQ
jgi:hypothetical protein